MRGTGTAVLAAMVAAALPLSASAQGTPVPAAADAAELTEARAILAIMFPPAKRDQMFQSILDRVSNQIERVVSPNGTGLGDPGADAMMADFKADAADAGARLIKVHMPELMEANALAYTHQFSLDELKQIHAFAETSAGSHYMSRAADLVNDPSYVAAMSALGTDLGTFMQERTAKFHADLDAYFEAHPDAAERVEAAAKKGK